MNYYLRYRHDVIVNDNLTSDYRSMFLEDNSVSESHYNYKDGFSTLDYQLPFLGSVKEIHNRKNLTYSRYMNDDLIEENNITLERFILDDVLEVKFSASIMGYVCHKLTTVVHDVLEPTCIYKTVYYYAEEKIMPIDYEVFSKSIWNNENVVFKIMGSLPLKIDHITDKGCLSKTAVEWSHHR